MRSADITHKARHPKHSNTQVHIYTNHIIAKKTETRPSSKTYKSLFESITLFKIMQLFTYIVIK